jgi:hypothetical protein
MLTRPVCTAVSAVGNRIKSDINISFRCDVLYLDSLQHSIHAHTDQLHTSVVDVSVWIYTHTLFRRLTEV